MSELRADGMRAIAAALVEALLGRRAAHGAVASESDAAVDEQQRRELIAAAAYEIAAQREFAPGQALDDWLAAEAAVDDELRALPRRR